MSAAPCELLAWDSEFFGCRIARVTHELVDVASCEAVEQWCDAHDVECLYYLSTAATPPDWLTARGFVAVDVRLTLGVHLAGAGSANPRGLRRATPADIPTLRDIAAVSHRATRFHADPRLAPRASALYETWIEKSVAGMSDAVFVPNGGDVTGYVTCDSRDGSVGQIGLLGVATRAQGQGLGRQLIAGALDWFAAQGCGSARVVTQGANVRAIAAYQACGFRPIRSEQWYHRWFRTGKQ